MAPEDTTITTEHCTESMEDNIKSTCISSGSLSNNDDSNNNDTDNGKINNAPQAPKCSRYETNSSQGDIQPPQLKPPQGNIQNEIILRSQEPTSPVAGAITMATMHSPPDTSIAEPSVDLRIHQQRQLYHSNLYGNTESGPYQSVVAENTALCSKSSGEISISPILSDTGLEERGMINRRNWYEDGYPRQLGEPVFMSEHLFQEQHQQVQQQHFQPSFDQIQRYPQLLQAAFTQPREMQPNHATLQLQNDPYTAPSSTPQSSNMETMSVYTKSPDSNLGSSAITTHLQQSDQQLSILQQQEPLQQITLLDNSHLTLLQQRHELQQTLLMQRQRQAQMSQQVYLSTQETRQNQGPIVELVKQNMGQQHLLQTQYPFWQQQQQKQLEIHHSVFNLNGLVDSPEGSNASMSLSPVPSSSSLSNAATPPPISSNTHSSSVISGYTSADFGGVNDGRGALQQQHSAQLLNRNNFMY
ncbi:hypothetical protein BCR41DRAFT_203804 [Lobosporangium transversale]|uniref:Uncharacterized protein n=1 Tax=Lobosporangium transversale TaxID=64571 RepID=A0A1Y2GWM9_9FUNG|nr:hypothetical protein BCR41DRAFT_203804 [Lobosporangium transversale]ORZ26669.1 hypothetical protein BCR41DRAFT_203804 [Lobosporangium transversale]|eukprot:XP_021884432.1 hypothetical protein BCR41DRAFT_203804 [Lobosporangium transversale]